MTFREIEEILLRDGWYRYKVVGSRYQYKHNKRPGKITIPKHCKDLKKGTLNSILKQANLKEFNERKV